MKKMLILSAVGTLLAASVTLAGRPLASPFDGQVTPAVVKSQNLPTVMDFGDPGDLHAAALAGADYLVAMQADFTEDNAGNGSGGLESPDDPDDAGWDWVTTGFSHTTAASANNIYGATIQGILQAYLIDPKPAYLTAMQDAADHMIAVGATVIRTSADMIFLLDFAPYSNNPTACRNQAAAIWANRTAPYGGSGAGLAANIRDTRYSQGWNNGLIPWDVAAYAEAAQKLHAAFPGMGYDAQADAVADVLYQDSFQGSPGYFDPDGANQGYDATYTNTAYYLYSMGVASLIQAFGSTGSHLAEIPGLQALLLACQSPDGAFCYQYGVHAGDEDWQCTAYSALALSQYLTGMESELNAAATWLAATQHASGGYVYGNGDHYPEVAGECTAAVALATGYEVTASASTLHIGMGAGTCPETTTLTYSLASGVTPYRSYTVFVDYDPAVLDVVSVNQIYLSGPTGGDQFAYYNNESTGTLEISMVMLGNTPGVTGDQNLFSITFDGIAEMVNPGTVVSIANVVMRDPSNGDITASWGDDVAIEVDNSAPVLASATFPLLDCINANFTVGVSGSDNVNLDRVEYRYDSGSWVPATPLTGLTAATHSSSFTASTSGLLQGAHTIAVRYVDDVCHNSNVLTWDFTMDTAAPVAATSLVASPRSHGVYLTWNPGSGHDEYLLYRYKRPGYPYSSGLPGAGIPVAAGILPIASGATSYLDDFGSEDYATRGVYDYALVSADCSPFTDAVSNVASATNYFLGDWAAGPSGYDGFVCNPDLTFLSGYYGLNPVAGTPGVFEAGDTDELDVAPTSNMGPFGLPGPDARINFEDLIILAINYRLGCTTPLMDLPVNPLGKDHDIAEAGVLELRPTDAGAALLLDGTAMGYSARVHSDRHLTGACLDGGMVMFYQEDGVYVIDAAGMGSLLDETSVLSLSFDGQGAIELVSVDARDANNQPLGLTVDVPPAVLPVAYELAANYPNPFNPTTTLRFALPVSGDVRLAVYNMLGQQVALLVNGNLEAGWHSLVFDASSLASGVYYSRLEAGSSTAMQKMLLVK